jgi:HEAT repeat protein
MSVTSYAAEQPSDEFLQQIVKLLGDPDREFRAAGLEQVRTGAKGTAATKLFTSQLANLDAGAQVALLSALADRGDSAALPTVLELVSSSKEPTVRAAAITAIGRLGSAGEIPLLINSLSAGSNLEQAAARQSLVQLSGVDTNKKLAQQLKATSAGVKAQLIEALATRRASGELAALVEATVDNNGQVRSSAMNALGQLGRPEQIAALIPGVLKAQPGGERDNAERNVALICSRIGNEDDRGTRLIEALKAVPAADLTSYCRCWDESADGN